eukprot:764411-Hanusia_phi.AAC.1
MDEFLVIRKCARTNITTMTIGGGLRDPTFAREFENQSFQCEGHSLLGSIVLFSSKLPSMLFPGDEIVEICGKSLENKSLEEVNEFFNADDVDLTLRPQCVGLHQENFMHVRLRSPKAFQAFREYNGHASEESCEDLFDYRRSEMREQQMTRSLIEMVILIDQPHTKTGPSSNKNLSPNLVAMFEGKQKKPILVHLHFDVKAAYS